MVIKNSFLYNRHKISSYYGIISWSASYEICSGFTLWGAYFIFYNDKTIQDSTDMPVLDNILSNEGKGRKPLPSWILDLGKLDPFVLDYSIAEISSRLGKTKAHVTNVLRSLLRPDDYRSPNGRGHAEAFYLTTNLLYIYEQYRLGKKWRTLKEDFVNVEPPYPLSFEAKNILIKIGCDLKVSSDSNTELIQRHLKHSQQLTFLLGQSSLSTNQIQNIVQVLSIILGSDVLVFDQHAYLLPSVLAFAELKFRLIWVPLFTQTLCNSVLLILNPTKKDMQSKLGEKEDCYILSSGITT